jgi:hypothetical protein
VTDALGYAGKRVIVAGAATHVGVATVGLLVELGAEVHAVAGDKPDVAGLASFTACDLADTDQVDAAVERIGRVVNMVFVCIDRHDATRAGEPAGAAHLVDRVATDMLPGSAVVTTAPLALPGRAGVRANTVVPRPGTAAVDVAWALVLLNCPRAAAVLGARIELA